MAAIGLAAVASVVALFAALAWRRERSRRAGLEGELGALRGELDSQREAARSRARSGHERGDELAELRRKLEKARKRAFVANEEKGPLEARAAELEAKLRARELDAARLRDALIRLQAEHERAVREGAHLREEQAHAVQAAARQVDPEAHRQLAQRCEAAEQEARRIAGLLRDSEREASRYRQRERVQRRAYTVLRGELDVARDRIRALQGLPGESPAPGESAELGSD